MDEDTKAIGDAIRQGMSQAALIAETIAVECQGGNEPNTASMTARLVAERIRFLMTHKSES